MEDNADRGNHHATRNNLMRRLIVQALLELDAELPDGGDERTQLDTFKAATLLRLFPARGPFQDLVAFDNDFYIKWVVPKIEKRLAYELQPLANVDLVTDSSVGDKYSELYVEVKTLTDQYKSLLGDIVSCQQLLHDVLSHRQWALRQKIAQAEVDILTLTSTIFDKKLIKVSRDIYDIFRLYRFDEAIEIVSNQIDQELRALQSEIETRTKKHEVYLKAQRVSPEIDNLLDKYQSTTQALNNLQMYQLEEQRL